MFENAFQHHKVETCLVFALHPFYTDFYFPSQRIRIFFKYIKYILFIAVI